MKKSILLSATLYCLLAAAASAADLSSPAGGETPAATGSVAQETAPSIYTVAQIFQKGAELNGKKVVIHGQVFKVTAGIMGKTWAHIQDGTGDSSKGTNDIICISDQKGVQMGDAVAVIGIVKFDPQNSLKLVIDDASILK